MLTRSLSRGDVKGAADALSDVDGLGEKRRKPSEAGQASPARAIHEPVALEAACPGEEVAVETPRGPSRFWRIRRTLAEVMPTDAAELVRRYVSAMRGVHEQFDELAASEGLCVAADADAHEPLFMDTETCGFSGSVVFLVGVMYFDAQAGPRGDLVFEQWLARNYAEEPAIMHTFARRLVSARPLVTFNGKAFDMNMIRERSAFHGLMLDDPEPPHLDLLHESRRVWKGVLPNCRLQTLEKELCGRARTGDIPGAAIPDAYHRFVDTADARQVADILHHNLLDLLTMAEILAVLLTGCDPSDPSAPTRK